MLPLVEIGVARGDAAAPSVGLRFARRRADAIEHGEQHREGRTAGADSDGQRQAIPARWEWRR